ncbi:MAG: hypothetical protein ACJ77N_10780 [Chloroflexota bacterium]
MKRTVTLAIATLAVLALALPNAVLGAPRGSGNGGGAKVAVIVGPSGVVTDEYRSIAERAARAAAQYTNNVVRVYSPNATWPAVKRAISGASIVLYLGHGNGWPSRYRDSLFPPTQNGFGLNPFAGSGDNAHQYFGEAYVDNVKLAPNAVVVLTRLCYASGNTEPHLAVGTVDMSIQRVDNFAAGFIRAGAKAVIADAFAQPSYYMREFLGSSSSILSIWRGSPTWNGHEMAYQSKRSKGFVERLDPDRRYSGFYRSLVTSSGLRADEVVGAPRSKPPTSEKPPADAPAAASLVSTKVTFGEPALAESPTAGVTSRLTIPVPKSEAAKLPRSLLVGVRWDPILLEPDSTSDPTKANAPDPSATDTAAAGAAGPTKPGSAPNRPQASAGPSGSTGNEAHKSTGKPDDATPIRPGGARGGAAASASPTPAASARSVSSSKPDASAAAASPDRSSASRPSASPDPSGSSDPSASPAATAGAGTAGAAAATGPDGATGSGVDSVAADPPQIELIAPEQLGDVVDTAKVRWGNKGLVVDIRYPTIPGIYRLVPTIHQPDGVAYDAATQAMLKPMIVHVGGRLSVAYGVTRSVKVAAGNSFDLPVRIANTGSVDWAATVVPESTIIGQNGEPMHVPARIIPARLVAVWLSTTGPVDASDTSADLAPDRTSAGHQSVATLHLTAPEAVGSFLVLLDVVTPDQGSLAGSGAQPAIVRVIVSEPQTLPAGPPAAVPDRQTVNGG